MTNKIPTIIVKSEVKKISNANPNLRDVVCLIGGFETDEHYLEPTFYETLEAAEADLADGSATTTPDANLALKQIFHNNISGVLAVNVSTESSGTWSRSVTGAKLDDALAAVKDIEFDLLYVAEELTDALITKIDTDAKARFADKKPYGYIGAGTRATTAAYTTTAGKLGDYCYAFIVQTFEVEDTELSLIESGAYLTSLIASLPVGNSLTAKVLPEVTDVSAITGLSSGDDYTDLVGLGYFILRLLNPMKGNYECVNSATANGLDLYINRVRDYIVNDFALRPFLGERNNEATIDAIKMECNRLLTKFKNNLGVVENITYAVEKAGVDKVNVILNTIEFNGVITEIDVFITIEVI